MLQPKESECLHNYIIITVSLKLLCEKMLNLETSTKPYSTNLKVAFSPHLVTVDFCECWNNSCIPPTKISGVVQFCPMSLFNCTLFFKFYAFAIT